MNTTSPSGSAGPTALDTFDSFLQSIWKDNFPEEAYALWRHVASNAPHYPATVFDALDSILSRPPADLIERMQQHGWLFLAHEAPDATLLSFDEHVDWLRTMKAELQRQLPPAA